jgi:transposase
VEDIDEQELHVERVAALDLGKAALEACVRVPHESGRAAACRRSTPAN